MSGWTGGRERRETLTTPAGVVDVSGSYQKAAGIAARQVDEVAGVIDRIDSRVNNVVAREMEYRGEEQGLSEDLVRDADGKLTPPDLSRSVLSLPGQNTRRAVLASRYSSEFILENQKALTDLRASAGTDPEAFMKAAKSHTDGVLSAMPAALRGPVGEGIGRETQRHYRSMMGERLEFERKEAKAAGLAVLENTQRDYLGALGSGNAEVAAGTRAALETQIAGQVQLGLMLPTEGAERLRTITVLQPLRQALVRETMTGGSSSSSGAPAPGVPYVAPNLPQGVDAPTDQLVRTVIGEAGGEDDRGKLAVAHVVLTRARTSGTSVTDVVFAKNQFEPWNNAKTRAKLEAIDPASPQYQAALKLVQAAQSGAAPDPTGGATHFYSPKAQAGLGREPPKWDDGRGVDVGNHRFFKQSYGAMRGGGGVAADPGSGEDATGRAMQTAIALVGGPGSPGWRAEWNGLREDERVGMAQTITQMARLQRAEADHTTTAQNKAAATEMVGINVRLAEIDRIGSATGGALPAEVRTERTALEQRMVALSAQTGSNAGAQTIRANTNADEQAAARQGQDATSRFAIQDALTSIAGPGGNIDASPDATGEFERVAGLPLAAQAQELGRRAREYEQARKDEEKRLEPLREFGEGIRTGTQLKNNAVNQDLAMTFARQAGQGDALAPAGMQALLTTARSGVVPQRLVTQAADAMQPGGDPGRLMQMTTLHQMMSSDPMAERAWIATLDPRLTRAYEYLKNRLPGMDLKSKEGQQELAQVRTNAAKIAAGGNLHEDAKAALGPKAADIIDGAVTEAVGMAPASLPPPMRRQLNDLVLEGVFAGQDVNQAAALGVKMLQAREGWGQSQLGASIMPQPENRSLVGMVLSGDMRGELPARWMRHPPEAHVAPFGAGGEVGTRWISERVRDLAKDHKLPNAENAVPGRDLVLRIDDDPGAPKGIDGKPTYQLHYQRAGIWHYVRARGADGKETAAPLRLDLAAEAKKHKDRWQAPGGGFDALRARNATVSDLTTDQRAQRLLGNPTDSLNPGELWNPRAGR